MRGSLHQDSPFVIVHAVVVAGIVACASGTLADAVADAAVAVVAAAAAAVVQLAAAAVVVVG
jgi:hypothetical protein